MSNVRAAFECVGGKREIREAAKTRGVTVVSIVKSPNSYWDAVIEGGKAQMQNFYEQFYAAGDENADSFDDYLSYAAE